MDSAFIKSQFQKPKNALLALKTVFIKATWVIGAVLQKLYSLDLNSDLQ